MELAFGALKRFCVVVGIALLGGCSMNELREPLIPLGPQEAVITLDPSQRSQTIIGWEATAEAGQDFHSFPQYRDQLMSAAVNDLGLNRIRLEVRSGVEKSAAVTQSLTNSLREKRYRVVNDNDDPFVINQAGFDFSELDSSIKNIVLPMRKLLNDRGEVLFVNLNYVDFGPSDFEHRDHPEEYAEFILTVFVHMRDAYGFVPDSVEVILEPDNSAANWTPSQLAQAIVATSSRLKAHGFHAEFIAPSTTRARNASKYIDEIASIPEALDAVTEFSYHRYDEPPTEVVNEIRELAERYGKRTSMLEWIGADQDTLHEDLKLADVSAWQQYTLAYSGKDEGDSYFKVDSEESDPKLSMSRTARVLSQYFRYVRRGAVRIGASTSNDRLEPVAFVNLNGGTVIVIKAAAAGVVTINNLPAGHYAVSYSAPEYTRADEENPRLDHDGREPVKVSIPSSGVTTVSASNGN